MLDNPEISSWQIDPHLFWSLEPKLLRLKPSINPIEINVFMLHENELSANNIRISNNDLYLLKKFCIDQLSEAEAEKRSIEKKLRKISAAKKNGEKSGHNRKETANNAWAAAKPAILHIAKTNSGIHTANSLAEIAVKKKIVKGASNTAKKIRSDKDFAKYLKKKKADL